MKKKKKKKKVRQRKIYYLSFLFYIWGKCLNIKLKQNYEFMS